MDKSSEGVKVVGFWVSAFTQRVRWALKLKGIDYEYIEEDILSKSPLLFQLNPVYGKVPVLVHDGKPLPESAIILEYIDEIWKEKHPSLLPQDPYQRAQARFWAKFADEKLVLPASLALCSEGQKQWKAAKVASEALENLEKQLKGKTFFGGDGIGYLDIIIGLVSYMLPVWEEVATLKILDPLKFPAIAAWTNNFLDHAVIKGEYLPSKAEMIPFYQQRREELIPVFADYSQRIWNCVRE